MKNPQLETLVTELKKASIENDVQLWKSVAVVLEGSTKKRPAVNLSKIDKYSKEGETAVIPGKVLSMGLLTKNLTIAAYSFSASALEKIKLSGSKAVSIHELVKKNPKGSRVRVLG